MGKGRKKRAELSLVQQLENIRSQVQKRSKPSRFVFARDRQNGAAEILESDDVRLRGKGKKTSSHESVSWQEDDLDAQFLASTIDKPIWGQLLDMGCEAEKRVADNWATCQRLEESAGTGDHSADDQKRIVEEYQAAFSDHYRAVTSVDALFQLSDDTWDPYWPRMYSWVKSSRPIAVRSEDATGVLDRTTESLSEKLNKAIVQSDLKHLVLRKLVMSACGVPGKDREEQDRNWFALGKEIRFVGSQIAQHEKALSNSSKGGGSGARSEAISCQTETEVVADDENVEPSTAGFGRTGRKRGKQLAFEPTSPSAIIALKYDPNSTPSLTVTGPACFNVAQGRPQEASDAKELSPSATAVRPLNVDTLEDLPVDFSLKAPRVPIISELEEALTRMTEQCLEKSKDVQTHLKGMSDHLGLSAYHSSEGAIDCFVGLARAREEQKTSLLSLPPTFRMLRIAAEKAVKARLDAETKDALESCSYPSTRKYAESWTDVLSLGLEWTLERFSTGLSELAANIYKQEETAKAAKGLSKTGTSQRDKQLQRDGAKFAARLKGRETELGLTSSPNTFEELKETLRLLDQDCEETDRLAAAKEMMSEMDDEWEKICERSETARALLLAEEAEEQVTFDAVRKLISEVDVEWERMCRHDGTGVKLDWAEEVTAEAEEQAKAEVVVEAEVTSKLPRGPRGLPALSLGRRIPFLPVCPTPPITSSVVDPRSATPPVFRFSRFPRSNHPSRGGSLALSDLSSSGDTLVEWDSLWLPRLSEFVQGEERGMGLGTDSKYTHVKQATEPPEEWKPSPWQIGAPSYADMLKALPTYAEPESLVDIGEVNAALGGVDQSMEDRSTRMVKSHADEDSTVGCISNKDLNVIPPRDTGLFEPHGEPDATVEYLGEQSRVSGLECEVEPEPPQGRVIDEPKSTDAWRATPLDIVGKQMRWDEEYHMHNTREYSRRFGSSLRESQEGSQTSSPASASNAGRDRDRTKMMWDEEYYNYNRSQYPASGTRLAGMSRLGPSRSSRRRELRRAAVSSWLKGFARGGLGGAGDSEQRTEQRSAHSSQGDGSEHA